MKNVMFYHYLFCKMKETQLRLDDQCTCTAINCQTDPLHYRNVVLRIKFNHRGDNINIER